MQSVKDIGNIEGKRVIVRVDFNVPIIDGKIEDDFRIQAAIPTLNLLLEKGAEKLVLISHHSTRGQSLVPVQKYLAEIFPEEKVELLENLRFNSGEESNDMEFAKELAKLGGIYVNEAFPVSHREAASIVGLPKLLPHYAGLQLEKEVQNLSGVFLNPKHPFLFILGGAKFSTKMPLIEKYLDLADHIFIGGALLNDFLKSRGFEVGRSLTDGTQSGIEAIAKNTKVIIPEDLKVKSGDSFVQKKASEVGKEDTILDLGDGAVEMIAPYIKEAKLILWNGPLGKYEEGGAETTKKILELVANSNAETIIGGGDTAALVTETKMENRFSFVSTGGGAALDFLANGTLPGIKALE